MGVATTKEELLKAARTAILNSGLSARALAEQTGISKSHINDISQSDGKASLEVLLQLADHFEIAYRIEGPKKR